MGHDAHAGYLQAYELAWNVGEVDALDTVTSVAYRRCSSAGATLTLAELKESISAARQAFPDLTTTIEDSLREEGRLVLRWSSRGTHLDTYLGVPATGKEVHVSGVTIARFEAGEVVEEWVTWDARDLLTALGVSSLKAPLVAGDVAPVLEDRVLRDVHRKFVTGVTIVTTMDGVAPRGLVVNAFVSVSLDPPLILVCVARTSSTHAALMRADSFAVNILGVGQEDVAGSFARSGADKFAGIAWRPGILGCPVLGGSAGHFEARVSERVQASTHTMFIGHVVAAEATPQDPLVYLGGALHDPSGLYPVTAAR